MFLSRLVQWSPSAAPRHVIQVPGHSSSAAGGTVAADTREEPAHSTRRMQDVDLGAGCDSPHSTEDPGPPAAPVAPEPVPEVGTFARPADGSPDAPKQREVEQNYRVRGAQTHIKYVVRAKITLSDPGASLYELILCRSPRLGRHGLQAAVPEDVVQMDDREIGECS